MLEFGYYISRTNFGVGKGFCPFGGGNCCVLLVPALRIVTARVEFKVYCKHYVLERQAVCRPSRGARKGLLLWLLLYQIPF